EGHNNHVPTFAAEHATWTGIRHMPAGTGWLDSAPTTTVGVHVRLVIVVVHVEHRNIQMMSLPGPVAGAKSRNTRQGRVHPVTTVPNANQRNVWRIVRFTDHRGDARVSLGNVIIARFAGQRSTLAKSRDRAQNDTGSQLLQSFVTQAHLRNDPRLKIL